MARIQFMPRDMWHPRAVFFIVLWLGFLVVGREGFFKDPGTFWHSVVGEEILRSGRFPRTDHFSYTKQGEPWIAQQWLGECAMALARRVSGWDGLLLAAVTLVAATFAFIADRLMRAGLHASAAALVTAMAIGGCSYHFHIRPHLLTMAMMAWLTALLVDVEAGRISPKRLLLLPPAFLLWSNVHGGALGGLFTIVLVFGGWLGLRMIRRRSPCGEAKGAGAGMLGAVLLLSAASVLINPYGVALPRVWLSIMDSKVIQRLVIEHQRLEPFSLIGAMVFSLAVVYLALFALSWRSGWRVSWWIPLLWLALGVSRVRHAPLFSVTAAVVIADMLPHSPLVAWFARQKSDVLISGSRTRPLRAPALVLPAALVLISITLQATGATMPVIGRGWARLPVYYWPIEAAHALEARLPDRGERPRIFNEHLYGGYLIDRLPELKVYIDDRRELYGDEFLSQYGRIREAPAQIEDAARQWKFTLALVPTDQNVDKYLRKSAQWKLLHRDSTASLYERKPE